MKLSIMLLGAVIWPSFVLSGAATLIIYFFFVDAQAIINTSNITNNPFSLMSGTFVLIWVTSMLSTVIGAYLLAPND